MKIRNIRTFIPSKDFVTSRQFYLDLGFDILWEGEDLVIFGTDENNFFLQNHYNKEWADNFMLQMHVDDLNALYDVAEKLIPNYEGTRIRAIFETDYGTTFHLIGPAGELWHMMQAEKKTN